MSAVTHPTTDDNYRYYMDWCKAPLGEDAYPPAYVIRAFERHADVNGVVFGPVERSLEDEIASVNDAGAPVYMNVFKAEVIGTRAPTVTRDGYAIR